MSISGEEFADRLRAGANGLQEHLARVLIAFGQESVSEAQMNFTPNDLKKIPRKRNTSNTRTGGAVGSVYRPHVKTPNSGYMVGPRAITGNLRASLNADLVLENNGPKLMITAGKKNPVKYAAAIEFGYPARNIEPRMYLGRGIDEASNTLPGNLSQVLHVAIVGGE